MSTPSTRQNAADHAALNRLIGHDEEDPREFPDEILRRANPGAYAAPGARLPTVEQLQNREEAILAALQDARTEYPETGPSGLDGPTETELGEADLSTSAGRRASLAPARTTGLDGYAGFDQGTGISGPNQISVDSARAADAAAAREVGWRDNPQKEFGVRSHLATGLGDLKNFGPSRDYLPGGERTHERKTRAARMTSPDTPTVDAIRRRLAAMRHSINQG